MDASTEQSIHRLVFTGSFGEYFLWHLLMIISLIPILGSYFQYLFLKWLVRNTVMAPIELTKDDIKTIVQRRKLADEVQKQMTK